jgi:glutathionylspermidine synthase
MTACRAIEPTLDAVRWQAPLRASPAIEPRAFADLRRRAILDGCKWDPQVGDVSTLAPFPLLLRRSVWTQLAVWAEQLTAETIGIERQVLERPKLLKHLGLPDAIRRVLQSSAPLTPAAARVMRFDFHLTTEGWRVSEVNSDVPGGFTEASFFTSLMAEYFPAASPAGNPAEGWARSVATAAGSNGLVCLLSAPGFMEDHQIMAFLGRRLQSHGCRTLLANPSQLSWRDGVAFLETNWHSGPLSALVRFYQGEWLPRLPRRSGWRHFFRGGRTPVANPGLAMISESKRLPVIWDKLVQAVPTWRKLLPETRDPRNANWDNDDGWLLKGAFSNTADDVCIREVMMAREWRKVLWSARLFPRHWIAQRRFQPVQFETPQGLAHACLGVYTINGRAAGIYGRMSHQTLIDYASIDVAVLIEDDV